MKRQDGKPRLFSFTLRDFLIFAAIFICALVLCTLLRRSDISDGFASPVFVLAVLLTSRFTNGYLFGTLAAFLIGISLRNYGSNSKVSEICSLNGIADPDDIKIGQEILLP